MLERYAEREPERFASLALRFDTDLHSSAMDAVIRAVPSKIDPQLLADVCEHGQRTFGSAVGQAICRASEQSKPQSERLLRLVAAYVGDPDPDREWGRTRANSGDYYYGGDLESAGLNSTRGQVAYATAVALFESADHMAILLPVVERLAVDANLGVRAQAAEAVLALMNHDPSRAYELSELLLNAELDLYENRGVERLMSYLLVREPARFGPYLARALGGPPPVARRAGRLWAILSFQDSVPGDVPTALTDLPLEVRRGAAEAFARNVDDSIEQLTALFDDSDKEVRENAAGCLRFLEHRSESTAATIITAFTKSKAFDEHFDDLIKALESMDFIDPDIALDACEHAVRDAGGEMGDIPTSNSMLGQPIMVVVLRIYRQGTEAQRAKCLDIIDRLSELNAYGVSEALGDVR